MCRIDPPAKIFSRVFLVIGCVWCWPLAAKTFNVDTVEDTQDADLADGVCADINNHCSLRAAIQQANQLPGPDTVVLGAFTYALSLTGSSEQQSKTGDLDITDDLTIQGAGATTTIIDGDQIDDRIFDIKAPANVTIRDLTIQKGKAPDDDGGAIKIDNARLKLSNCVITKNKTSGSGGAIYVSAYSTLTIDHCTVSDNTARYYGGGIYNFSFGTATVTNLTFSGNRAMLGGGLANGFKSHVTIEGSTFYSNKAYSGGAIATLFGNGSVLIANSTISANHSGETGGGLSTSADTVTISNSTITKNSTSTGSAGGVSSDGMLYIRNSILAENINGSGAAPDCSGEVNSDGFNLIGNTAGCSFNSSSGDLVGTPSNPVAPLLGPLTNNGGPTFTHALLPNSPAIDAGNPLPPGSGVNACEVTDQRGAPRQGRGVCDIGAFESTASGDTSTGTENNSGDIGNPFAGETGTSEAKKGIADRPRNPFFGETRTSQADTKTPHTPEHQPQPPETSERASRDGRNGEDRSKEEASALSRLLEFLGLNEKTTNSGWSSVESNHYVDEWLDVNNINTAGGEAIPRALTLGASVTIVAGVVNLFVRSMNLLGMFFSFPLWSRIDPIPVLLLANKEIKRRKKQAGKEAELENKGGHLGQVLDD